MKICDMAYRKYVVVSKEIYLHHVTQPLSKHRNTGTGRVVLPIVDSRPLWSNTKKKINFRALINEIAIAPEILADINLPVYPIFRFF